MKSTILSASMMMVAVATIFAADARAHAAQTKGGAASGGEACSLLTKEAAAAALGEAVQGPEGRSMETTSSCEYTGSGLHKVHLNVMHFPATQAVMYKAMCAQKGHEGLNGLGETSCWYNAKHEELQVLKGTTFFSIEMRRNGDPTEAIKGVAKSVFDRMK